MRRWTIVATTPPNVGGYRMWRARWGSRSCSLEALGDVAPTDAAFDAAFQFAWSKYRAKKGAA